MTDAGAAARRRGRFPAAETAARAVHVHIDRLVLHGVATADAPRLAAGLERELAARAVEPSAHFEALEAARLPPSRIAAGRVPEQTGRTAANAVWSALAAPLAVPGDRR
jgi:hypothetical protein